MTSSEERRAGGNEAFRIRDVPFNFRLGQWNLFSWVRPLAVVSADTGLSADWAPRADIADGYLLSGFRTPVDRSILGARPGWTVRTLREYPRYLVDLTVGFDDYMGKFSGKTRSTLKRKMRKFAELSGGQIVWKQYRTTAEVTEFLALARALSAKTYQERLLGAGLPTNDAFTAEVLDRACGDDVRAFILFLNNQPVSYLYLPVEGARVIYAYLGYDPAFAEHSPGTVLQLIAMELLFAEPRLAVFDFTQGEGQHKQLFSTHAENCTDILFTKRGTTTARVASAHAAFMKAEQLLTALLARLGLKTYLKNLLRRTAG